MNSRLRILVSAYACSPDRGSEPGVGWGFVHALARTHEVCVITEEHEFKDDINRYLSRHPELRETLRFEFVPRIRRKFLERVWPPSYYWTYRCWQKDAFNHARLLIEREEFDIVHQLNMIGFREPGYLWKLGIPFVWGPVGGMGLFPWKFLPVVGWYGALYYIGYNLVNLLHMHFLPRPRVAAKVAGKGLIAANMENRNGALLYWDMHSTVLFPVGPPSDPVSYVRERVLGEPFRIIWVGMHTPGKALNLGLEACSRLPKDVDWELHILGEGPRTAACQRLTVRLGIHERCRFHGRLLRDQVLEIMEGAHAMLFSSLREGTPSVIVEAFTQGLPVVCLDHSGMADMCDASCGISVPVTHPRRVIADLAQALERLARDEPERQRMAMGALRQAANFSWEHKARKLGSIYHSCLSRDYADERGSAQGREVAR